MPIFEEALEAYQLPLELKYLPVIESALNPTAVSRVGATGLWQFMIGTAKQYDLEVNSLVDERRDPVKSSYAAARYLSDLYRIFGDWNLVIAAYNCGPDNINKAIHRAGGENKDYWYIYPYLPKETRGYVPAFIAANYVMNYYCEHNICPMTTRLPVKTDTVVINRQLHLKQIAAVLDLDINMVRALNPELRRDVAPGNSSPITIRLAQSDITRFIDMQDSIFNYNTSELLPKRIETSINDDVPTVGRRKSARNQRSSRNRSRRSRDEATASSGSKNGKSTITIRRGDTLGSIAKRNGTTISELKRLNNLKDSKIRAGQSIKVR
jgi:membrane-bound lytic murein transglycosylase D